MCAHSFYIRVILMYLKGFKHLALNFDHNMQYKHTHTHAHSHTHTHTHIYIYIYIYNLCT